MQDDGQEQAICYAGRPTISEQGREVLSFHLHRYLAAWLKEMGCARVLVTVGFDDSNAELGAYRVDTAGAQAIEAGWTKNDLRDAWRFGNGQIIWDAGAGEPIVFDIIPVFDGDPQQLVGFVTVRRDQGLSDDEYEELARLVSTAITTARRNGIRLFFDEATDHSVKALLYATMDHLPEWTGCDHSAAVLLTHDLDAITLEDATEGSFNVLAERIFFPGSEKADHRQERLVGMAVDASGDEDNFLSDALRRFRRDRDISHFVYRRFAQESQWHFEEHRDAGGLDNWHGPLDRPRDSTVVLVPLVHHSIGEGELLGFLSLSFERDFSFSSSVDVMFREMATNLAGLLHQSPLYTLSVRKMWVIRKVRDQIEEVLASGARGPEAIEGLIGSVSDLVANYVAVPSFAMGYIQAGEKGRIAKYVHPHGWSRYDDLELEVDVAPEARVDSGISALALRLERPVILAGGHGEGADLEFKNRLWVDEEEGLVLDSRGLHRSIEELEESFRPLGDYYKPARESAYASLAYPMIFAGAPVGVLTVEVEKDTDWLWWTGFGGHLFWDMVARQLALAIYLLRPDQSLNFETSS